MGFCGINGFGKVMIGSAGGSAALNIFTQMTEPDTKDGIWVKTNSKYQHVICDDKVLYEDGEWSDLLTMPFNFIGGSSVVYRGEVHFLGGSNTRHYKFDGSTWTNVSTLPYNLSGYHSAVVYNDEIHIAGSTMSGGNTSHYKFDGSTWTNVVTISELQDSHLVVFNNEIHALGGHMGTSNSYNGHRKFDGSRWISDGSLPFHLQCGSAVVYNGEVHIMGGCSTAISGGLNAIQTHYKFDGNVWTNVSTLPFKSETSGCVVYNGCIHLLGSYYANARKYHYKFDGSAWTSVSTLPYELMYGNASVSKDNSIFIFSGNYSVSSYCAFTCPDALFEKKSVIIQRGDHNGIYLTNFVNASNILGDNKRFLTGFDDVWYFDVDSLDITCEMYYGNGTEWVKFKN